MRKIVVTAVGIVLLLYAGVFAALAVANSNWFHGKLPPDTLATNASQAEDVAFSIASNAGCGDFESGLPESVPATWGFTCARGDVMYDITVYGGDDARAAGLAQLQSDGRPFVAKAYYAVETVRSGATKEAALSATPPPASIMDPFS